MPLVCHARHIGLPSAFDWGGGGNSPFLCFLQTSQLLTVFPHTIRDLISPNRTWWKFVFSFPLPVPTMLLPLRIDMLPMVKPVIPQQMEARVAWVGVLVSSSKSG